MVWILLARRNAWHAHFLSKSVSQGCGLRKMQFALRTHTPIWKCAYAGHISLWHTNSKSRLELFFIGGFLENILFFPCVRIRVF
jgi:hypothetical protein